MSCPYIREDFPAGIGIEDQCIVSTHISSMGQDRGIFGGGHLMACLGQKIAQDWGGFVIRVPAARQGKELHA
jgi:hypothetical protein